MSQYDRPSRRTASPKQNTFFGGAAILAVGIFVVKLIGMLYRIPLVSIIGEQGTADFSNAYNIYAVLLTVSTAGLPVAVSKLISEADALGRHNQVRRVFRLALALFLCLGTLSFLVMFFRADALAVLMHDEKAAPGIRALAPAVICVGCLSAFRGYSQGHRNMVPTAVSQIIEALCKLFVGLSLAYLLTKAGQPANIAAAGAITGVTVGTVVALAYLFLSFVGGGMGGRLRSRDVPDRPGQILGDLLRIAIPITLSSSMVGIVTVIDSSLVQGQLQKVLLQGPEGWQLYREFVDFAPLERALDAWKAVPGSGTSVDMAALTAQAEAGLPAALALKEAVEQVSRTLYGNYSGALNIYNLPTSLITAITASVIPAISAALTRRSRKGAARLACSALRVTALMTFPMGVGLCVLGTPIVQLIYPRLTARVAGPLLSELGIATLFVCMMLVCNSVLQAYGFVNLPVAVMLLGGCLKIFCNYRLVGTPGVGIFGAPFGNVLCFSLCMVLDLLILSRVVPRRLPLASIFLKPAIASALMGGAAWAVYGVLARVLAGESLSRTGNAVAVLAAILTAVVIYCVLVVALRAISREDLTLMPKGEKLARLLRL